jgi:MoaA/NifB/PqqE/SkfB family radical SAM enzyme
MRYTDYAGKILGHIDRVASLFSGSVSAPVNVEIDLSNRCSLGCQACHFAYTHTKGPLAVINRGDQQELGDLMEETLARNLLSELSSIGVRSVTWTGGGEPTLHPKICEILRHGQARRMDMGIYTHGGLISDRLARAIGDSCRWAYVSLDCVDRETYQAEKRVDGFDAACTGAQMLAAQPCTLGVGFLLHEHNWRRVDQMADLALSLGADYVQFRPAIHFSAERPNRASGSLVWIKRLLEREMPTKKIQVEFDERRFRELLGWQGHGYGYCFWSGLQTVVTPNGKVWTCCNKRGFEGECLGDLTRESFTEIWKRRPIAKVNDECRVMCRGHMPNKVLHEITITRRHGNFI